MTLLVKRRSRRRSGVDLFTESVGSALVVRAGKDMTVDARSLASSLAEDPEHLLVVADLPIGSSAVVWDALASVLPKERRGLRLVLVHQPVEVGPVAGQWLSERLGRMVVVPDGPVSRAVDGSLFVHSDWAGGWVRFRPGQEPQWESKRFPRPAWDSPAVAELRRSGPDSVAEPLPAGMWIRSHGPEAWLDPSRVRLRRTLPCRHEGMTLVLGGHGIPELPLADVAQFWATLSPDERQGARFVQYGRVALAPGRTLGPALADLLKAEVTCYTGIPVGAALPSEVFTLRSDGSQGWNTYAQQYAYQPENSGAAAAPRLSAHRPPVADLPEVGPGVYRWTSEAVVEVIESGLWIRPPGEPVHAAAVRAAVLDPMAHLLRYEAADHQQAERMRAFAETLLGKLDYSTRLATRLVPVTAGVEDTEPPAPALAVTPLPWLSSMLDTETFERERGPILEPEEELEEEPEDSASVVTAQPTPEPANSAWPVEADLDVERDLVRENFSPEFDQHAEIVETLLARNPKLLGKPLGEADAAVTDAVALRMYLAGQGPSDVDRELRAARPGPHVAFGRCVAAGLHRLRSHRGTAVSSLTPSSAQWEFYRRSPVLTERGFLNLLAAPHADDEGGTDLLVWSMTGRRAALLEPGDRPIADRIVFLPGTSFKVLDVVEPSGGARGRIMLRELSPAEIGADGTVAPNRLSLDKLAKTSLHRSVDKWAEAEPGPPVPGDEAGRFRTLPGIC